MALFPGSHYKLCLWGESGNEVNYVPQLSELPDINFDVIFVSQQHTDLTMSDRESSEDEVCLIVLLWGNMQMQ